MRAQGKDLIPMNSQGLFGFHCTLGARGGPSINACTCKRVCVCVCCFKNWSRLKKSWKRLLMQKWSWATWEHTFQLLAASRSRGSQVTKCCWILRLYWLKQMLNRRTQACTRVHTPRVGSQLDVRVVLPGELRSQSFFAPDVSWAQREPPSS